VLSHPFAEGAKGWGTPECGRVLRNSRSPAGMTNKKGNSKDESGSVALLRMATGFSELSWEGRDLRELLDDAGYYVVVVGLGDFAAVEGAGD